MTKNSMTKKDLVEVLVNHFDCGRRTAGEILDMIGLAVRDALEVGHEVTLPGLGKLKVVDRAPRKGHNPRTGEAIDIPAKRAVKFVPAKSLKDAIEEDRE